MTSKKNIIYRPSWLDSRRRSDAEAARLLFGEEKHLIWIIRNIIEQFHFNLIGKYATENNLLERTTLILDVLLILHIH